MSVYRFLTLCGTVGLLLILGSGNNPAQQPDLQKPTPLPEDIEKAWAAAGFEIGWMRIKINERYTPAQLEFVPRGEGQKGDIPAFRLRAWQTGLLPNLPEPQVPFGLDLSLRLTDSGLVDLRGLNNLQWLDLRETQITDAGLKELAALKNLQWLDLSRTQITDAGLKELAALKNLQWLNLSLTKITDAGLKELAALKNLQGLDLSRTQITDAGLKELAALKNLQRLDLWSTQVTDAVVEGLRTALPKCYISR